MSSKTNVSENQHPEKKGKQVKGPSHLNIFLYVPNLIGYGRFICTFICVKYALDPSDEAWIRFVVLYSISQLLDAIDGFAARKLD